MSLETEMQNIMNLQVVFFYIFCVKTLVFILCVCKTDGYS